MNEPADDPAFGIAETALEQAGDVVDDQRSPRERIYDAAVKCFQRDGLRGTTMEAVAAEAGISRPALYYYYENKQELIIEVLLRQLSAAHRRSAEALRGRSTGLDAVLDAAVRGLEVAAENPYLMMLAEGERLIAAALQSNAATEVELAYWRPLLADAREREELRTDLTDEEIVRWITFTQFSIITHGDLFRLTETADLRTLLERFLAPSLRSGG